MSSAGKKRARRACGVPVAWYAPQRVVLDDFARGALAAGMLAALQEAGQGKPAMSRRTLRLALQGGAALAAGTAAVHALRSGQRMSALLAVGAGCSAIALGEAALQDAPPAPALL